MPPLDTSIIVRELAEAGVPWQVVWLDECGSTNREALDRATADPRLSHTGLVVLSEWQSAGRGRRGAKWCSPPSRDLLLSVALRPELPPEHWSRLTHAAAVAVCKALERDFNPRIKWPNDIYLDGKKVAGILVESQSSSATDPGLAAIGIGHNVNSRPEDFPEDLAVPATSLWTESGSPASELARENIAVRLLSALHHSIADCADRFTEVLDRSARRSLLLDRQVHLTLPSGKALAGEVIGFGNEGELQLRDASGVEHCIASASEVRLEAAGDRH